MDNKAIIKNLPPILGMVTLIVGAILLRRYFFLAIPVGLLVWWASARYLTVRAATRGDRRLDRIKTLPDERTRQDMRGALAKISTLQTLNAQIPDERLTAAMDKLAQAAGFLVDETIRRPKRAGIAHKALALYLDDAVEVSQRFADLQRYEAMSAPEIEKTAKSLEGLITLFQTYAKRMRKEEALDLDIKITVLEDRLRAEGIFER